MAKPKPGNHKKRKLENAQRKFEDVFDQQPVVFKTQKIKNSFGNIRTQK